MTTKETLKTEKNQLINSLTPVNHTTVLRKIKNIESQIKELDKISLIDGINRKYTRLRNLAKLAYDCEQPSEDITTNDGTFHKAKVKKYPNIAALEYASATWKDGRFTQIRINGENFNMFSTKYNGYDSPITYTRPKTFSEFLALNAIPCEDITIEQYNELTEQLNKLNTALQANIAQYKQGLELLNVSNYSYWGLLSQHNVNLYEYLPQVR